MAEDIVPVLTQVGREALTASRRDGAATGISMKFTSLGFGSGQFTPDAGTTALREEKRRIPVASVQPISDSNAIFNISVTITDSDDGPNSFKIGEVGLYGRSENSSDPVLFAVMSQEGEYLSEKFEGETFVFSFNFILDDSTGINLEVSPPDANLNLSLLEQVAEWAANISEMRTDMIEMQRKIAALEARG